ncbi:transferrin-binding protein-like solute binding protein [Dechloromonas denitrificans]|uniref:transferrin-binding protein-like solute binding protein n=1 Tax=Dechloromonas denitrificans TaxID=281362 RepID=UPI001CF85566|nr:transferrin-binding protein-like solute binding protein [Dechloromonas denitrificans]UCV10502.1 transferrin-binding protein-like solute binding protein [Dechloromonas denitrificans]
MSNRKTIIAASIIAILASGSVIAKGNDLNEDKWGQTRSYGQVFVSDDSVDSWGPWGDFVEPAAGGPIINAISMLGAGSSDSYRNIPALLNPVVANTGCAAGTWCGYAISKTTTNNGYPSVFFFNDEPQPKHKNLYDAALFELTPNRDGNSGEGTIAWRLTSLSGTESANSGGPLNATFGGGTKSPEEGKTVKVWVQTGKWPWMGHFEYKYVVTSPEGAKWDNTDESTHHFTASSESKGSQASATGFSQNSKATEASDAVSATKMWTWFGLIPTYGPRTPFTDAVLSADEQVAVGEFFREVLAYTSNGQDEMLRRPNYSSTVTEGYYVAGVATPQAYLDSQRAGNVSATYRGGSFDGSRQGYVTVNVDFGQAKWNGSWYGGTDSQAMNFNASGNINGANLASTSVSATPMLNNNNVSYSGSVNGTFYGQQAGSIGGVSNVSKAVNNQIVQTQNAVFLVNKVVQPK